MTEDVTTKKIASVLGLDGVAFASGDPIRDKRLRIAELYGRYRAARKLLEWAIDLRGPDSPVARQAQIAAQDTWNSLQIMKALIWLDDD